MEIALLCVYALALLLLGRNPRPGRAAFFLNNRRATAWSVGLSLFASCVGASATIGVVGLAFVAGTPAWWWLGSGALGLVVLSLFLAGRVRRSGVHTLPELAERILGPGARPLTAWIIVVAWTAILAAQFTALVPVLENLTGLQPAFCLAGGLVLVTGHALGGQSAVMKTDVVQSALILAGLGLLLCWLTAGHPGWTGRVVLEAVNPAFPPERLAHFLCVLGGGYLVCPMLFGRLLSARDTRAARRGGLGAAAGLGLCACLLVAVGLICRDVLPPDTPSRAVLPDLLHTALPGWLRLAMLFALAGAVVSSADSCLLAAAAALSRDILDRPDVQTGRRCVAGLGMAGAAATFLDRGILELLLMANDVYVSGVVAPVCVALLAGKRRRPEPGFGGTAVAAGGLCGAVAAWSGDHGWTYGGMLLSGGLTLAGILLARLRSRTTSARAARAAAPLRLQP